MTDEIYYNEDLEDAEENLHLGLSGGSVMTYDLSVFIATAVYSAHRNHEKYCTSFWLCASPLL